MVVCGDRHLKHLDRIIDPLVVTDLATVLWSPHNQPLGSALDLAQVVLTDSVDHDTPSEAVRETRELSERVYVVDLAWLRGTPWRERIATAFDPPWGRAELRVLDRVVVRHHPDSTMAALLLVGWLASRLRWTASPLAARRGGLEGRAHAHRQDVSIRLEPMPEMQVRGLFGVELESASGRWLRYDRGPGGLRARYRPRAARSASGRSSARRAASPGSSEMASARRCCAIPRTRPRSRRLRRAARLRAARGRRAAVLDPARSRAPPAAPPCRATAADGRRGPVPFPRARCPDLRGTCGGQPSTPSPASRARTMASARPATRSFP